MAKRSNTKSFILITYKDKTTFKELSVPKNEHYSYLGENDQL